MSNKVALKLGGRDQELLFDFGTLDHIETVTGEDPLNFSFDYNNHASLKRGSFVLVYAGLLTSYEEKDKAVDFTKEDVEKWAKRISMATIIQIINAWGKAKDIHASGEGAPNTQAQATEVA